MVAKVFLQRCLRLLDYLLVLAQIVKQFRQKLKERGNPKQI